MLIKSLVILLTPMMNEEVGIKRNGKLVPANAGIRELICREVIAILNINNADSPPEAGSDHLILFYAI
jgi:hypothetical protein